MASKKKLLSGCLISAIISVILLVLLLIFGLRTFVNFGIASDISQYIELVQATKLDAKNKQYLLTQLESLRAEAHSGHHVDVQEWITSDELIRKILFDKKISETEFSELKKELNYLHQGIKK